MVKSRLAEVLVVLLGVLVLGLAIASPETLPQAPRIERGGLRGQVLDPSGAGVPDALVEVDGPDGHRAAKSGARGEWRITGLREGAYAVTVTRKGFTADGRSGVRVDASGETTVDVRLALAPFEEKVNVDEPALGLSAADSAGAVVLEGEALDALPDDPDELLEALQALAGDAAGPDGGQVFVDGFSGGRLPPKSAIRQIRLNASPFSAEHDRPGFGRIEILTRPGSESYRGQASFRFSDDALNTKDPYATDKPDYRRLAGGGSLGGPIVKGRASFFLDLDRQAVDDTELVNATVLGEGYTLVPFNTTAVVPRWRSSVSPRLDAQLGAHTLTARFSWSSSEQRDRGIGGFSLPSRAYDSDSSQTMLQLGDTVVLGKVVNETRLQWVRSDGSQSPLSLLPALEVQEAFSSGGASVGRSSSLDEHLELQNVTSWTRGRHSLRAGFRLRGTNREDVSRQGFNGTVTFAGTFGPELDETGAAVLGPDGTPVLVPVTSIERYRRTVLLQALGLPAATVRSLGGGASQLVISGGDPESSVRQWDLGAFVQDEWRLRQNLSLGIGLRYENQTNLGSDLDLAPRINVSWSPGPSGRGAPKTVLRAGAGVFYDRIGESLVLEARRLDGSAPRRYVVSDAAILDTIALDGDGNVSSLPSFLDLGDYAQPQVVRPLPGDLRTPLSLQTSLSVDRALPGGLTGTLAWIGSRTWRALRSRVVPAPQGLQADSAVAYQTESTGRMRQDQLVFGLNRRFGQRISLSTRYFLSWARSDTEGASSFPADSADLDAEWGRSSMDVRHRVMLTGSVTLPWNVRVSPFLIASSGRPYNITIGRDVNGDTVFSDRPSYASDASLPGLVQTRWGLLNPTPGAGERIIPRNLADGPGFVVLNLRLSKSVALRRAAAPTPVQEGGDRGFPDGGPGEGGPPRGGQGGPPGGFGGGFGGGRGGGFGGGPGGFGGEGFGGRRSGSGPSLTFAAYAQNLLNHVNAGTPVGNLSSPRFGQSLSSGGGFGRGPGAASGSRSIELSARISF